MNELLTVFFSFFSFFFTLQTWVSNHDYEIYMYIENTRRYLFFFYFTTTFHYIITSSSSLSFFFLFLFFLWFILDTYSFSGEISDILRVSYLSSLFVRFLFLFLLLWFLFYFLLYLFYLFKCQRLEDTTISLSFCLSHREYLLLKYNLLERRNNVDAFTNVEGACFTFLQQRVFKLSIYC